MMFGASTTFLAAGSPPARPPTPNLAWFLRSAASLFLLGALCGCGLVKPQRGGRAHLPAPSSSAPTAALEITQPENPAGPSTQTRETTNDLSLLIPAGSTVRQMSVTPPTATTPAATNTVEVTVSAPTSLHQTHAETATQVIGAAQKDTSRELGARLAAMRPVQWVGILLLLGAGALAYFGWWTKAAIAGAVGVGMIVVAAVLPGHEAAILAVGGVIVAVALPTILYVYHKGVLDHVRQTQPSAPSTTLVK